MELYTLGHTREVALGNVDTHHQTALNLLLEEILSVCENGKTEILTGGNGFSPIVSEKLQSLGYGVHAVPPNDGEETEQSEWLITWGTR